MKILFATDGSDYASQAAVVLAQLSARESVELTVLTVTYLPDNLKSGTIQPWYSEWRQAEEKRILEHYAKVNKLVSTVKGSVTMRRQDGSPTHEILEVAEEIEADLIVMGARGHSTLERILVGSVSDAVATHADCSVLIIRPDAHDRSADGLPVFHRVLAAFDGSDNSRKAVKKLLDFQWPDSTTIEMVAVAQELDVFGQEYAVRVQMEDHTAELQQLALQAKDELQELAPLTTVKMHHGRHVGDTLVQAAEKSGADLLILGESGHSSLGRFLMGSTTKFVLRHAPCSVWIARDKN